MISIYKDIHTYMYSAHYPIVFVWHVEAIRAGTATVLTHVIQLC